MAMNILKIGGGVFSFAAYVSARMGVFGRASYHVYSSDIGRLNIEDRGYFTYVRLDQKNAYTTRSTYRFYIRPLDVFWDNKPLDEFVKEKSKWHNE